MGILDRFKAQPKGEWTAGDAMDLEFDFDHNSLSGLRLRDPISLLWRFGPPDDTHLAEQGAYCYYTRGIEVDVSVKRVDGFVLMWRGTPQFQPFAGHCRYRGANLKLAAGMREADCIGIFGEPFWRDEDADEIILFYEHPGAVEWQMEFGRQTGLSAMVITALPLLADAKQRQAYHVSKPWPPA